MIDDTGTCCDRDKIAFQDRTQGTALPDRRRQLLEWQKRGTSKVPLDIHVKSGKLFGFAGLYEHWTSPQGTSIGTCAIITT